MTDAMIRKGVMSHWSAPGLHVGWVNLEDFVLGWHLSHHWLARRFPTTELVTDDFGKWMLVDCMGLAFDSVRTDLERLDRSLRRTWCVGKLLAYGCQTTPFLHVDSDVFLQKPLPHAALEAAAVAQSSERFAFTDGHQAYPLGSLTEVKWLPREFLRQSRRATQHPSNLGVAGGNDVGFLRAYSDLALEFATRADNRVATRRMPNQLLEQWTFGAMAAERHVAVYHLRRGSEADEVSSTTNDGYVHLLGGTKRHESNVQWVAAQVERLMPSCYARRQEQVAVIRRGAR